MPNDENTTTEAFEQLAAMYLTDQNANQTSPTHLRLAGAEEPESQAVEPRTDEADDDTPPKPTGDEPLTIEGVMIGHLPGFANLWLGQYAQRLATTRGPVAVMAVDDRSIELELYGQAAAKPLAGALADAPSRTLEEVLAALAEASAVWLVKLPAEPGPPAMRAAEAVDTWTALTSANDAAVVHAYRQLKLYFDASADPGAAPAVRLMLCGCDDEVGARAAERLARTTEKYLSVTPLLVGVQRRMEPIRKKRLGAFDVDEPWKLLADLLRSSPAGDNAMRDADDDVLDLDEIELAPHVADTPGDLSDLDIAEGDLLDDDEFAALDDEPEIAQPGEAANGDGDESLAQYVRGVELIEARCPSHESVELAVDGNGVLHLLARTDGDPEQALRDAYDTRAWAVEHARLLRLTCPRLDPGTDREPTVHLFTDRPKPLGELAFRGKAGSRPIRLHLLLPVVVGDTTTWTHVELN